MRIENPTVFAPSPEGLRALAQARAVDRACVVPVAEALSALVFDAGPDGANRAGSGRLGGEIGGGGFPKRAISTRLALRRGGWRHVLLVEQPADRLARTPSVLTIDGAPVAAIDPTWLQSPLADLAALIDGLTDAGRNRLLRMLATTGASLFGGGGGAGLGRAIQGLVQAFGLPELRVASRVSLGRDATLFSCRLPARATDVAIEGLVAFAGDRVARVAGTAYRVEALEGGALLHMIVPTAMNGRTLLSNGPRPMTIDASAAAPRPMAAWFARRTPATRVWAIRALEDLAPGDATVAALLHELRHRDAPPPVLTVRSLSAAPGGLLFFGEIRDPNQLIDAIRIDCGGLCEDVPAPRQGAAGGQPIPIVGLVPASKLRRTPARCRIRLVYASGRVQSAGEAPVTSFDGAAPAGFARLGLDRASTELAAARLSRWRPGAAPRVETIGAAPSRPTLAIVTPAGADPDLLRARAAMLFAEDGARQVEMIYHAGAGEAEAVSRLLGEIHDVFGLGGRLLVFDPAVDPAERLRVALAAMRSPTALVLGAAALPATAGWLDLWRTALSFRSGPAIRGGTLLAADGAVIDAGGRLDLDRSGAATITRRGVGLPASLLPQAPTLATGVVSAACVGLSRRAIAALGRLDGHYPDPDALLLALAHRFRRGKAASVTMLDARFVRFAPEAAPDPLDAAAIGRAIAALVRTPTNEDRAR